MKRAHDEDDLISIEISKDQLIVALKKMNQQQRDDLIEDLIAQASPEYLASIREPREDYRQGRVLSHNEVFEEQ